jgi:hypothetical protein
MAKSVARKVKLPQPVSVRFYPATFNALKKAAADDDRPTSTMVERIVSEWLREKGYLK